MADKVPVDVPTTSHFTLQWHVTDRCNLRCAHCYQGDGGEDPSYEDLRSALRQYQELLYRLSVRRRTAVHGHINLTGGEPLLREDLADLIKEIVDAGLSYALLTNGTLIDDAMAEKLHDLQPAFVQVSVDGREGTHDGIRGKGSYRRAVDGLQWLHRASVRTMVSFTAHGGNVHEMAATMRSMRKAGADKVWTDRMLPLGSGVAMSQEVLSPQGTRDYVESLAQARRRITGPERREVAMDRALQFLAGGTPYRCTAGDSLLALLPDGQVYPCRRMPLPVGSVHSSTLWEIYNRSVILARLRDHQRMDARCRECSFGTVCHGGLRCLSLALTGDPFTADPGCWLANP